MYLSFYRFKEFPFSLACDERYFYQSSIHAEALANMQYTIEQRKGMVMVTGEVGAGKTFVGHVLANRLGPGCTTAVVRHPPQSGKQLLRALAAAAGMNLETDIDTLRLVEELEQHLIRMHNRGRLVAMILDECQDLSQKALEEIRLLWNFEQDGQRLIQIVLIGQPELQQRLQEPQWESLRQRIVLSYHLGNLTSNDTHAYIGHRLRVASIDGQPVAQFSQEALAEVFAATNGIPRLVNILCDNALLVGFARNLQCIDRAIITEVLREMTCWNLKTSVQGQPAPLAE
ncbi:MAG: AAA family ATPase [Planctomycetes bacterium]|jgi:general secretion pathway protein A|nr:AAA family ATPase [Planctomycetota bacterium]